jgi:hypothetical protein
MCIRHSSVPERVDGSQLKRGETTWPDLLIADVMTLTTNEWFKFHVDHPEPSPSRCTRPRKHLTHLMKFSLSILSLSLLAGALASNVVDLDPSNFDSLIGQGKPALVEL